MSPLRIYLVDIMRVPVCQLVLFRVYTRFFQDLAHSCLHQGLMMFDTARHRLPVTWMVGTFQQQYLHVLSLS